MLKKYSRDIETCDMRIALHNYITHVNSKESSTLPNTSGLLSIYIDRNAGHFSSV